jgi:hypothetical protein
MAVVAIAHLIAILAFVDKRTVQTVFRSLKPTTVFTKFIIG